MPPPQFTSPEFSEPGKEVGNLGQHVQTAHVEAQLNQPADVSQAHQFFQPQPQPGLPNLSVGADGGASLATIPHGIMPGGEHALSAMPIGADKAALAMLTPTPGAEQAINPLIQLIMKMPGLTGLMNNFFEFLMALFDGDIVQSLTAALLDPTGMMLHLFEQGGDSIPLDVLSTNTPVLNFQNGMFMPSESQAMNLHSDLAGSDANVGAPIQNPDLQQAIFEKTSNYTITDFHQQSLLDWHGQGNNLALGPDSGVYRPTMGSYQAPAATTSGTTPSNLSVHHGSPQHSTHSSPAHHAPKHHFKAQEVATDHRQIAQATPTDAVSGQYTVQSGDNLWDIAKHNLGDGSRWGEIYKMNADLIGNNPDLIQPGTALHMPDGNSVASAGAEGSKYIVQPGDNLWSIGQQHGGQSWGDLYRANQGVIGDNPRMIMPGQELSLDGGGAGSIASAGAPDSSSIAGSAPPAHAAPHTVPQHATPVTNTMSNAGIGHQPQLSAMTPETPQLAPVESGGFSNAAQVGGETTINSSTNVPSTTDPQGNPTMYTSQDGSLFYRNKPQ